VDGEIFVNNGKNLYHWHGQKLCVNFSNKIIFNQGDDMQPYGYSGLGVQMTQQVWNTNTVMPEYLANQINETLVEFMGKEILWKEALAGGFCILVSSENVIHMIVDKLSALKGFSVDSKDIFSYQGYTVIIEESEIFELDLQ
jgi:hypothetical protein